MESTNTGGRNVLKLVCHVLLIAVVAVFTLSTVVAVFTLNTDGLVRKLLCYELIILVAAGSVFTLGDSTVIAVFTISSFVAVFTLSTVVAVFTLSTDGLVLKLICYELNILVAVRAVFTLSIFSVLIRRKSKLEFWLILWHQTTSDDRYTEHNPIISPRPALHSSKSLDDESMLQPKQSKKRRKKIKILPPCAPIGKPWYHGNISNDEANHRMEIAIGCNDIDGSYLVYDHPNNSGEFVLLVCCKRELLRWRICRGVSDGMYVLGEDNPRVTRHRTVVDLIKHHRGILGKPIRLDQGRVVTLSKSYVVPAGESYKIVNQYSVSPSTAKTGARMPD